MRRSITNPNSNKGSASASADESPPPEDSEDMNNIGLNLGVGAQDLKKIHEKRMRKGECPSCGVKCFKVTGNLLGRKKFMPLTIAGHVKDGICLTCHPAAQHVPTNHQIRAPAVATVARETQEDVHSTDDFRVPQFINDDNDTVVSGITLDHRLWSFPGEETLGDTRWQGHASPRSAKEPPTTRPEASYSANSDMDDRPMLPRRKASGRIHNHQAALMQKEAQEKAGMRVGTAGSFRIQVDETGHEIALPETEISLVENEEEDQVMEEEKLEEEEEMRRSMKYQYPPPPPIAHADPRLESQEIFFDSSKRRTMDYPKEYTTDGGIIEANSPRFARKGRISSNTPREFIINQQTEGGQGMMDTNSPRSSAVKSRNSSYREITVNPDPLMDVDVPPLPSPPSLGAPSLPPRSRPSLRSEQESAPRVPTRQLSSDDMEEPPYPEHRMMQSAGLDATSLPPRPPQRGGGGGSGDTGRLSTLTSSDDDDTEPPLREYGQRPPAAAPRMPRREEYKSRLQSGGTGGGETPRMPIRKTSQHSSISDEDVSVPSLLRSLQESSDSASLVMALESLKCALIDVESKSSFCSRRGVSSLNSTMWIDMTDSEVQQACSDLLLALVAKPSKDEPDFLTGTEAQSVIDALLIAMQQLLDNEELQQSGCRVLGCLARASANNEEVSDGSLSGAVLTILNAMEAHKNSTRVMEWGVRTLYEFCSHSRSAEANKRSMWSQPLSSGEPGWSLLLHALNVVPEDAVGLLWVLSSNEDGLDKLKPSGDIISRLYRLIQRFQKDRQSSLLVEAGLGCISNFASAHGSSISTLDATEICILALSLIPMHLRSSPSLCTEACAVVSNLAAFANKTAIVDQGGIDDLSLAMTEYHKDEALHAEAVNALLALLKDSSHVKEASTTSTTFSTLLGLFRIYKSSPKWQTTACQLFASIFAMDGMLATELERDGLNALCEAMSLHPSYEKVQESACVALSNFSGRPDSARVLAASGAVDLALVAMHEFPRNLTIQIMTCIVLWNLEYRSGEDLGKVDAVACIVKAIQNHIESERLLEVACGALLHLIYGSDMHKQRVATYGGVEAIACTLVMYSQSKTVLEKVCEVMASLSACPELTKYIIEADCIGNVVEILRSTDSISVYRSAALFLKNVVVAEPMVCEEAARGITTIVKAMQAHKKDPDLQREACNYLWSVAGKPAWTAFFFFAQAEAALT
eukprot:scaffold310_cov168-Amphora_coffeaeformis.AAC.48